MYIYCQISSTKLKQTELIMKNKHIIITLLCRYAKFKYISMYKYPTLKLLLQNVANVRNRQFMDCRYWAEIVFVAISVNVFVYEIVSTMNKHVTIGFKLIILHSTHLQGNLGKVSFHSWMKKIGFHCNDNFIIRTFVQELLIGWNYTKPLPTFHRIWYEYLTIVSILY